MRLIVTRPREQAGAAVAALRSRGVDAVSLPLIGIEAIVGPTSEAAVAPEGGVAPGPGAGHEEARAAQSLRQAWQRLPSCRLVMFVSANAVMHFFAAAPPGAAWPVGTLAGSTGPGTTAALLQAGVPPACVREPGAEAVRLDTETLWQLRLSRLDWRGAQVLVVRGEGGRDWLADTLRGAGAAVDFVAAYRRVLPRWSAEEAARLAVAEAHPLAHAWHFASSEAAHNLPRLAPGGGWRASRALATHPRIAQAVREIGFGQVDLIAPGETSVVEALSRGRARPGDGKPQGSTLA